MTDIERTRELVDHWLNGSQKSPELIDLIASALRTARDEGRREALEQVALLNALEKAAICNDISRAQWTEERAAMEALVRSKVQTLKGTK